ncbi:hypothetical protein ACHAWU_005347 [Discostella pseudostelligera]|uniref:Uncharacterized protein n=1 Tax=Discostella pseudostelligera TaxID=259834 RepID=A0ABD3M2Q4_9STRA
MTASAAFSAPRPLQRRRHFASTSIINDFSGIRDDRHVRLLAMLNDATLTSTTDIFEAVPPSSSSASSYGLTPVPEFEPVLNVEAASSFIIIAVLFTLLQIRVSAISNASQRRSNALIALRNAESMLLSGDGRSSYSNDNYSSTDRDKGEKSNRYLTMVTAAKNEYENALRDEMKLRTIVPGVRIIAPDDPRRNEEERAAAKRFLGWGSEEFGDDADAPAPTISSDNENLRIDSLPSGAKLILVGVASMLLVLLYTLSFDPMAM